MVTSPTLPNTASDGLKLWVDGATDSGAALGALGWVANQPWFQDFIIDVLGLSKEKTETKVIMQQIEEKYMIDKYSKGSF